MSTCPGCGIELPECGASYDRKFHASAECWALYEQVLAREYQDPALFGQVHQLTVDAYSVQHAGGRHPDKSVCIHLVGLCLALESGIPPLQVPAYLRRIAGRGSWPRLVPPGQRAPVTVGDVARAATAEDHALRVREWAAAVWHSWSEHHSTARELAGPALAARTR